MSGVHSLQLHRTMGDRSLGLRGRAAKRQRKHPRICVICAQSVCNWAS